MPMDMMLPMMLVNGSGEEYRANHMVLVLVSLNMSLCGNVSGVKTRVESNVLVLVVAALMLLPALGLLGQ